jgi:hypothetical protein
MFEPRNFERNLALDLFCDTRSVKHFGSLLFAFRCHGVHFAGSHPSICSPDSSLFLSGLFNLQRNANSDSPPERSLELLNKTER